MDVSTSVSHVVLGYSIFLMFHIPVSTENEAANSTSQFITQRATSNSVVLTLPTDSSCTGKFSQLCYKDAVSELRCVLPDVEYIEAENLMVINRLQPNTKYILKSENETLENCSVIIHTCPDIPPMVQNLLVKVMSHGVLVMWLPPEEMCQSQYNYFWRYKFKDSEYTNWTDVTALSSQIHENCLSNPCIVFEDHRRIRLTVQVRAQRAGEERFGVRTAQTQAEAEAEARKRASEHTWAPAWMSGLYAAVGAAAGLAVVTVLGVCYFDKRSKWRDTQETWDNSASSPTRPATVDDLLVPDIDVLIDCEIAPGVTQPAAELRTAI